MKIADDIFYVYFLAYFLNVSKIAYENSLNFSLFSQLLQDSL